MSAVVLPCAMACLTSGQVIISKSTREAPAAGWAMAMSGQRQRRQVPAARKRATQDRVLFAIEVPRLDLNNWNCSGQYKFDPYQHDSRPTILVARFADGSRFCLGSCRCCV